MLGDISQLLANPVMFKALLKLAGMYFVFAAFVGALPAPVQDHKYLGNPLYIFVFRFFNLLSANVSRAAVALKVPGAVEDKPNV